MPRARLDQTQLNSLYLNGQFEVESRKFENNYKWQVSGFLFEGRENTKEVLRSHLGVAHSLLIRTQRLYSLSKSIYMLNKRQAYSTNLWSGLFQIPGLVGNLFDLVFGLPLYQVNEMIESRITKGINEEKHREIFEENYPGIVSLALYLQFVEDKFKTDKERAEDNKEINKNREKLQKCQRDFIAAWNKERSEKIEKIDDLEQKEYLVEVLKIDAQRVDFFIQNFY